jgi:alkanesulfonate monooxygenase
MSGYQNLEEAYWFGQGVLPLLARSGARCHPMDDPPTNDEAGPAEALNASSLDVTPD